MPCRRRKKSDEEVYKNIEAKNAKKKCQIELNGTKAKALRHESLILIKKPHESSQFCVPITSFCF